MGGERGEGTPDLALDHAGQQLFAMVAKDGGKALVHENRPPLSGHRIQAHLHRPPPRHAHARTGSSHLMEGQPTLTVAAMKRREPTEKGRASWCQCGGVEEEQKERQGGFLRMRDGVESGWELWQFVRPA